MGMPGARTRALQAVAEAFVAVPDIFARSGSIEQTVARLAAIKGIGPWTAQYIALRACGEPDAFPASDVGLLRGMLDAQGQRPSPKALEARAEAWRPWRAYAAHHIWAADAEQMATVAAGGPPRPAPRAISPSRRRPRSAGH
jgi:AraC family transcriptional regulator of adaptative response / DNA-3-methyladenine glycosylase II